MQPSQDIPASIRPLRQADFASYLALMQTLVGVDKVLSGGAAEAGFAEILRHGGTQILGAEIDGSIASVATLHLIPNLTYLGRPYGLIENVVTLAPLRGQGLARAVMQAAIAAAWQADAYKIMLMTGRKAQAKGFYEKLGFSDQDKYAMTLRRVPPRQG